MKTQLLVQGLLGLCLFFPGFSLAQEDAQETLPLNLDEPAEASAESAAPKEKSDLSLGKKSTAARKQAPRDHVLDFEGEVIEGERRRPDLFLQMSIDNVKFDSLIYNRDDFNDYLEVDRKSRTRFLKLK